ncbi:N-acetyltransferase family protein [Sporolactobacillus sp. STCC-11]|uniref:GNAT family N-acetyltransferase n=1 Tax=Sporolactobacillus caesalpiniae TaxID=3230362 RepID=UPI00339820D3
MAEIIDVQIVPLLPSDWAEVCSVYIAGIKTGIATFQADAPSWEEWNEAHLGTCRFAAKADGRLFGWIALSPVSSRCCYKGVAELSIYILPEGKGHGIGTALMNAVIMASEKQGFWTLQSGIIAENKASRALHKKCGFREIGYRERIAHMPDGTWHDTILVERRSNLAGR